MKFWAIGCGFAGIVVGAVALVLSGYPLKDFIGPLIAFFAVVAAVLSMIQSKRSADSSGTSARIAELQEERLKYRWSIEPHPSQSRYVIRNLGSRAAFEVRIGDEEGSPPSFFEGVSKGEEVSIASGEARSFIYIQTFGNAGIEIDISWRPEGESERRTWREVLEPPAAEAAERNRRDELHEKQRDRERDLHRDETREWKATMVELADAWSEYRQNPTDAKLKLRVQILVASLPPQFAREMGYAVDVARDVWGEGEWPFESFVADTDADVIKDVLPEIELLWNMRTVSGYSVYGPIGAQGPNSEPRIWWAVQGYVERVRERESGNRRLRRSPADEKHRQEMLAMSKRAEADFKRIQAADAASPDSGEAISVDPADGGESHTEPERPVNP